MTMEHRWSERKPIEMEVSLYYAPVGRVLGKTRDVSLEGMYVRIEGTELPLHAELEVSFVTRNGNSEHKHNMPAYVVHENGNGGIGLMLRHVDYSDFYALRYMLSAA